MKTDQATLVKKVMPSTDKTSRRMQSRRMAVVESPQGEISASGTATSVKTVENEAQNIVDFRELWYTWEAPPEIITNPERINYAMYRCVYRDRDDPPTTPLSGVC